MPPHLAGAFRQRVYEIVRLVPHGQVTTYGFVSLLAGAPRSARQVGWALHSLPDELVWGSESRNLRSDALHEARERGSIGGVQEGRVPWHRVVNAHGRVSSHPNEAGTYRQMDLLRKEGIDVTNDGALIAGLKALRWNPDPQTVDALELPAELLFELDRLTPD